MHKLVQIFEHNSLELLGLILFHLLLLIKTNVSKSSGTYLSTTTIGPPMCSSSVAFTKSKTVDSGEHCCGQLGL